MKAIYLLGLLSLLSLPVQAQKAASAGKASSAGFGKSSLNDKGPIDKHFDHTFSVAEKIVRGKGCIVPDRVVVADRAAARASAEKIADRYKEKGYKTDSAEHIAIARTVVAWQDFRTNNKEALDEKLTTDKLFTMARTISRITVKTTPDGADVSIDATPCGKSETSKWVPPNKEYKVSVSMSGYTAQEQTVTPAPGVIETVTFVLVVE